MTTIPFYMTAGANERSFDGQCEDAGLESLVLEAIALMAEGVAADSGVWITGSAGLVSVERGYEFQGFRVCSDGWLIAEVLSHVTGAIHVVSTDVCNVVGYDHLFVESC